tara:strand:+ start:985 stop:1263 length:279 start_codon:yes stop_codon:yes gene_type:complete
MKRIEKNLSELEKDLNDLKGEIKDNKLSRSDRLLLDILSKMVDILISGFKEKKLLNHKRKTSNPLNEKEIRNERVLSLQDFLHSRGRPDRRK